MPEALDISRELALEIESTLPRLMRIWHRGTDDPLLVQLPIAQLRIVRLLYTGSRTVTALGEELSLTASAVTQMVNRLQDSALVQRVEDPIDRRIKHIALTEKARALMQARQERRISRLETILELIPVERQRLMAEVLHELINAAGELPATEPLSFVAEIEQTLPPSPFNRQ